ncbi:helix-turn-helix domain-containing protein [Dermabacteraceae bacterium TAE3-ERU5]|nr:helix-turn-helix domain-containing protein [Dermabacteraceae bacterium TAE3-ERU5]
MAPSSKDGDELRELARFLAETPTGVGREVPFLCSPTGQKKDIPVEVYKALVCIVEALAEGRGVSVVPTNTTLTTQQAADYLCVSRPTLVKLLEEGEIPFTKVGRHRRVALHELLRFEEEQAARTRQNLRELTRESVADGSYFCSPGEQENN